MYQITLRPRNTYDHWRALAEYWHISPQAKQRLEWLIFYHTVGKRNAKFTASYFAVSRKTFHKWKKRFNPRLIQSLEEKSRAPHKKREWEVTPEQEERIIALREKHLKYGKAKLKIIYQKQHGEEISAWKIERVIRRHELYPDYEEHKKKLKRRRRRQTKPKTRIHELKKKGFKPQPGRLWHTDTIILWWYGQRRVVFTALEDKAKLGYARVYSTHSSRKAKDFLQRLVYLSNSEIKIIHSDNGSEFAGEFTKACEQLNIQQVYNRVKTPQDNPALERFNWTVQDEWLALSEVGLDEIPEANQDLTEWLIEYNTHRPHQALDYQTPIEYAQEHYFKVLPMWSARTGSSNNVL
jgi:transposase InsO family protein